MSVDLDRQLRAYCELMDEAQDSISFDDVLERSGELQLIPTQRTQYRSPHRNWIPAVVAVAILVVVIGTRLLPGGDPAPADQPPTTTITDPTTAVSNGWVAYSTQPGGAQINETDWDRGGGDIYLVQPGLEPRLIVGRGQARITNVCPSFSPDGSRLAYGEKTDSDTSLVVLNVSADGSVSELTRIDLGPAESSPCPRWTHDGTRLAFLSQAGTAVVRGVDGSTPQAGDDDPTVTELRATMSQIDGPSSIPSPDGSSMASLRGDLITIVNTDDDGPQRREIPAGCGDTPCYGLAAWSPDGRYILAMQDTSGATARILAVSVEQPFETKIMVDSFPVNGPRSWPGFGDISWQPVFSAS